jgi:hypothetical protein
LSLALNRLGDRDKAQSILEELLESRGPSSETFGLLGRVHKDRWEDSVTEGNAVVANAHLRHAIESYKSGFQTDWRDAFPGVNALTLMAIAGESDKEFHELMPVVEYAILQRLKSGSSDYWDHASMLEVACLKDDGDVAYEELGECLATNPQLWKRETTVRNLRLLLQARIERSENVELLQQVMVGLQ